MYLSNGEKWLVFVDFDTPFILEDDKGNPLVFRNEDDAEDMAKEVGASAYVMKYEDYFGNVEY